MPASAKTRLPRARALYAQGTSIVEVAKALALSESTVYRWKADDEVAGRPWSDLRARLQSTDQIIIVARLEARLAELAGTGEPDPIEQALALGILHDVLSAERRRLKETGGRGSLLSRLWRSLRGFWQGSGEENG